ncbi:MAG: hypothetical protein ABH878_07420, partial [bacterium]
NGYQEGPPFRELDPFLAQAERWEIRNPKIVEELHTPPTPIVVEERKPRHYKPRKKRVLYIPVPRVSVTPIQNRTGRIRLQFLDLELIHRVLALNFDQQIKVREFLQQQSNQMKEQNQQ